MNERKIPFTLFAALVLALALFTPRVRSAPGATLTVTNTNDSGAGSLRQAILDANSASGASTINFNISGSGVQTIKPVGSLPALVKPVTIDGTTQPAYAGTPLIELDGSQMNAFENDLVLTGGNSTVRGLIINRANRYGIWFKTNGGNLLASNWIGINSAGTGAAANADSGVFIDNIANNTIGETTASARNIISGNGNWGIQINGASASNNIVIGNYVGTNPGGTAGISNMGGIYITNNASNNIVGGATPAERNLISGNTRGYPNGIGVYIYNGATGNTVSGNYIGTNPGGLARIPNVDGIRIGNAPGNTIGGTVGVNPASTCSGTCNLISGNDNNAIYIFTTAPPTSTNTLVVGNWLGVNLNGARLENKQDGLLITNSPANRVGGSTPAERNVISGNDVEGIEFESSGSTGNLVQGNYIGTNITGTRAITNTNGIFFGGAPANTILGNLISGNSEGIQTYDAGAGSQVIQSNLIGVDASGINPLPNMPGHGIALTSSNNRIGGASQSLGNVIAFNGADGIAVDNSASGNSFHRNLIYGHATHLDVDLGSNFVDNNPNCNPGGANNHQNFPNLTSAVSGGGALVVQGSFNCQANKTYLLEFFSHPTCVYAGHGGGKIYVGMTNVTTNGSGSATINVTFAANIPANYVVTANATNPANDTSEFSACVTVTKSNALWRILFPLVVIGN